MANNFKQETKSSLSLSNLIGQSRYSPTSLKLRRASFTLIELLVVLALVAILSVVVILTLNPAELLKQARDSNRLSDLATINTALNLFSTDVIGGFMGTSTVVYTSLVNTINPATTTCAGMGLPTLPIGWTYNCPTSTQSLRNTDGTGWIPVNFQRISSNSPISQLPIDPQNTTSTKYYTYVTGGSWKITATPESAKYTATAGTDGGVGVGQFEIGNNMSLAPFTDGLVGWWKFDEGIGTAAADSSGWVNNGNASGTTIIAGKVGQYARNFNGTTDYFLINLSTSTSMRSILAWTKISSDNCPAWCYFVDVRSNGLGNGFFTNLQIGDGWAKLFVDGISVSNSWASIPKDSWVLVYLEALNNFTSNSSFKIMSDSVGTENLKGSLDDLRVYNRTLSAAEVLAIYNATK